jgi:NADPH:quinone reductase-like Zn-dependent oxidoreductase
MKAIVWTKYGPPEALQLQEIEKPVPKDNEVLIRVHAASVTAGEIDLRKFKLSSSIVIWLPLRIYIGLLRPKRMKILGQDVAGEIEAVGKDVKKFKAGDQVFAATGFKLGGYAEYICLLENEAIAIKPANQSYEEAAAVPMSGSEALALVRKAHIQPGEKVLVNAAGGSIGTFCVQLARHFGAEVTAVDKGSKLEMLRSLGAQDVIDYTAGDFTRDGGAYDVIIDVIGKLPSSRAKRILKPEGRYSSVNPGLADNIRAVSAFLKASTREVPEPPKPRDEKLVFLRGLIEAGEVRSVVDKTFPLAKAAEAHRYAETGQKQGHIVLTVE